MQDDYTQILYGLRWHAGTVHIPFAYATSLFAEALTPLHVRRFLWGLIAEEEQTRAAEDRRCRMTLQSAREIVDLINSGTVVEVSAYIVDAPEVFRAMDKSGWTHKSDYMPAPHMTANIYTRNGASACVLIKER